MAGAPARWPLAKTLKEFRRGSCTAAGGRWRRILAPEQHRCEHGDNWCRVEYASGEFAEGLLQCRFLSALDQPSLPSPCLAVQCQGASISAQRAWNQRDPKRVRIVWRVLM